MSIPEIKDKIKLSRGGWEGNINKAVRYGHTRFGSWGTGTSKSHYIHYAPKTGKDAARHALKHLQIHPGESVLIQQGKFTGGVNHVVKGHGQAIRVINEDTKDTKYQRDYGAGCGTRTRLFSLEG